MVVHYFNPRTQKVEVGRLRQVRGKFETSLDYRMSPRPAGIARLCLKMQKKKNFAKNQVLCK